MVSREERSGFLGGVAAGARGLFLSWRVLLTRLLSTASRTPTAVVPPLRTAVATAASVTLPEQRTARIAPTAAFTLGMAATGVGALGTVLLSPGAAAGAGALVSAMWVLARLLAMRLGAQARPWTAGADLTAAWAAGALAQIVALTPPLRFAAWVAGAAMTWRYLRRTGLGAGDASWVTGWGYGLEVAGFVALALVRNLEVAIVLFGRG